MPETLAAFLKQRAERSYRNFLKQTEGIATDEALQDRKPNWPEQPWGVGQDGSMAGIVYHAAAWKQLTLPLFARDGRAGTMAEFDATSAPARDDWEGIVGWYRSVGAEWNAALADLPEETFEETRDWEGMTLTLAKFVVEMMEHDVQHASQLEYLRQRHQAESESS